MDIVGNISEERKIEIDDLIKRVSRIIFGNENCDGMVEKVTIKDSIKTDVFGNATGSYYSENKEMQLIDCEDKNLIFIIYHELKHAEFYKYNNGLQRTIGCWLLDEYYAYYETEKLKFIFNKQEVLQELVEKMKVYIYNKKSLVSIVEYTNKVLDEVGRSDEKISLVQEMLNPQFVTDYYYLMNILACTQILRDKEGIENQLDERIISILNYLKKIKFRKIMPSDCEYIELLIGV